MQPAMTVRDFWLFGEVVCVESWTVTQWQFPERLFEKVAETCWAGTLCKLLCQQGEKIEGMVCYQSVQLGKEIRKMHSEGISQS